MATETVVSSLAEMLRIAGPRPKDAPAKLLLKLGDKIVAVGDSITNLGGYVRASDAVLAGQFPELHLPAISKKGIGGQKAEDMIARWDQDVIQQRPAFVTLSVGINDVWHRVKEPAIPAVLTAYQSNVEKMVDSAQAAGIKVILLAPTVIEENPTSEGNKRLAYYVAAERKIAADKKCTFVDLHQMFLDALKKKPANIDGVWLTDDGVHMAPPGDALMTVGLLRALGVPDNRIAVAKNSPVTNPA